jgi:hypothetical protein
MHAPTEAPADMAGMLRSPRQSIAASHTLAMAPTAPFLLKHHWAAWEVASEGLEDVGGTCWLPVLKKHVIRPGINHVHTLKTGQAPDEAYRDGMDVDRRDGWAFVEQHDLDASHRPAGVPAGPYIREADVRDPRSGQAGVAYLEAWQVPLPTLPGDEEGQRFRFDRGSYNRWRLWLVESGQIRPPQPHIIAKITARYTARVPSTQAKQWPTTEMGVRMTAKATEIAEAHEAAVVPEAPAPVAPPPPVARKPRKPAAEGA